MKAIEGYGGRLSFAISQSTGLPELPLFQRGHDLPHATWKSFERFPMARATLQLCNEAFLSEVCENRSCELAGNPELKFFPYCTLEGFLKKV